MVAKTPDRAAGHSIDPGSGRGGNLHAAPRHRARLPNDHARQVGLVACSKQDRLGCLESAFRLRGYGIQPSEDGSTLTLKLYWQAAGKSDFDYSAFVHLIDESGQIVAQKDHAPGESLGYPPTSWVAEDIVADEHAPQIPTQLSAGAYRFRVGMYNWHDRRAVAGLSAGSSGRELPDSGSILRAGH